MRKSILLSLLVLLPVALYAQKSPEQLGGVYYAYPVPTSAGNSSVAIPSGYEPFYISHYGRHGSRWLTSDERYEWVLAQFTDKKNLTSLGKSVRRRLQKVLKNARGNGGNLSPLGVRQHQGIAERMAQNFPTVFVAADTRIWARSSTADRCRKSMLAFTDRLRQLHPSLSLDIATHEADMEWLVDNTPEVKALEKRTQVKPLLTPTRFMHALFKDPARVFATETASAAEGLQLKLLSELFTIATDMQDVELDVNLFDVFTDEEMHALYDANNRRMTICNGNLPQSEGIPARAALTLWKNIQYDANVMISRNRHGASLRFGHDTNLYRLLSLLQLSSVHATSYDHMDEILPMAANLQMVFFKRKGETPTDSTVLVLFLHNEKPVMLHLIPTPSPSRGEGSLNTHATDHVTYNANQAPLPSGGVGGGYLLPWSTIKACVAERIHRLEHLRQLCALNTMVGTAQANTQTAGLFGKGSEEHGQTLPAVLAPNGQNFWTPQTRDTEKKCVAPYYYADSLLQGFRNSHWIVGGCTQDYGSFTVAAISGLLRTKPEERATRFSHSEEVSHPHYYAVRLPDEHLITELTATSHTALMRITPEQDEPVHIVINHNSDEGEGKVLLDGKTVYGYNPVHRIYQGWGESAGFSGHFLLQFDEEPVASGSDSLCVWLTFQGKAHQPIMLKMASSFTDRAGCERNLAAEAEGKTFEEMQAELADQWIARLHTIDIDDPNTARVNQFYGALYRTSFLPREFSDVDGRYPRFASQPTQPLNTSTSQHLNFSTSPQKFFTDFSMWDTYRAVHPLYNIIAPTLSAQMMQSLVTMAEQGGWMPIFPCWNSYTAAMIGDHCASVIADAYVKGIGIPGANVPNYLTAYRYLRQNAFDSPSPEQYKNGMGRRALQSYLKNGFVPMEDHVPDAFHTDEQTSRTLEYAYDDFCLAQLALDFGTEADYHALLGRSVNWLNVINPQTGWADGRHVGGKFENNTDLTHRKSYITEGATCHYSWYVPHDVSALIEVMGGPQRFEEKLDSMFEQGLYWHGNEPCHQIAYLYNYIDRNDKTRRWVRHILDTEYNDTPGGLSGNDDAGQMSAWYIFSSLGFYPVCPGTPYYQLSGPTFRRATLNLENGQTFTIEASSQPSTKDTKVLSHSEIMAGGTIRY